MTWWFVDISGIDISACLNLVCRAVARRCATRRAVAVGGAAAGAPVGGCGAGGLGVGDIMLFDSTQNASHFLCIEPHALLISGILTPLRTRSHCTKGVAGNVLMNLLCASSEACANQSWTVQLAGNSLKNLSLHCFGHSPWHHVKVPCTSREC